MKAIRVNAFGGPEVLKLEEVPDLKPGPGQVLVNMKATGLNPFEGYIRAGMYPIKPSFPYTPGGDGAGVVEAVGQGVTQFKAGDRVYLYGSISGAYAQQALCEPGQLHALPSKISYSQGAAIGVPYGTAYRALFLRAKAKAGETVLVHGASGGVGTAAVQLARAQGLTVIGTAGTEKGRQMVEKEGAHHVLDHKAADFVEKLMALTGGKGVDVIIEMLANVNLAKDLKMLATRGRVVVVGSRGPIEIDPRDTMGRDAAILGMTMGNASEAERREIHAYLGNGLENGTLRPVVGQELPLVEAARGHQAMMEPGAFGKIVLIP